MILAPSPAEAGARAVSWHPAALCLASLLGIIGLFFVPAVAPALLKLEHWTADWRTALLSDRRATTHPDIAIVAITSETLEPYPFILPVDRGLQADIVEAVVRAGARAVALDFYFTKGTIKESDDRFQRVLASVQDKLILGAYENLKPAQLAYQYDFLGRLQAPVGYLNLNRDRDDTVRSRAPPPARARYQESFSTQLAHAAGRKQPDTPERIAWLLPPTDGSATFLRIEAHRLLDPSTGEAARLKNRVVIIAGDFPYFDRHRTPLSLSTGTEMTGAEIHAQMAAELIDGNRSYSAAHAFAGADFPGRPGGARGRAGVAVPGAPLRSAGLARGQLRVGCGRCAGLQIRPPHPAVHAGCLRLGARHHARNPVQRRRGVARLSGGPTVVMALGLAVLRQAQDEAACAAAPTPASCASGGRGRSRRYRGAGRR